MTRVNLELAQKLDKTSVVDPKTQTKYYFNAVTAKAGQKTILIELNVDAYDKDGEWSLDDSCSYSPGDKLYGETNDLWLPLI